MRIMIRECQLPHSPQHRYLLLFALVRTCLWELYGIQWRKSLKNVKGFVGDSDTAGLLEGGDSLADIRTEKPCPRLVWVCDELEGKEHGG